MTESSKQTQARLKKNSEVGKKGTKERGYDEARKLFIISGTPFGSFKKRLVMTCMTLPTAALLAGIFLESDGSLIYVNALWVTTVVYAVGMLTLLFAQME